MDENKRGHKVTQVEIKTPNVGYSIIMIDDEVTQVDCPPHGIMAIDAVTDTAPFFHCLKCKARAYVKVTKTDENFRPIEVKQAEKDRREKES